MGLAATIAGRSLVGRPGRTAFSILGVALGIATVVCVFTVDHVSVLSRAIALDPGWGADLEVRPSGSVSDAREELMRLEGVAGVAAFFQNNVRVRPVEPRPGTDDWFELVHLIALEAADAPSLGVYFVQSGSGLEPRDAKGVLIGGALAQAYGLGPGDRVFLATPPRSARRACVDGQMQGEGDAPVEAEEVFTVRGVLAYEGVGRRGKGNVVVIDYDAGRRLYRDVFVESQFWVKRDDAIDLEVLEANLGGGFSFERNESRAAGQMADERAFRNGVRVAGLFALLLGLFVIFHTLSMALIERVREVGTLHSLGTTPGQLARVFFVEALVIAVSAGVLGIGGGLALARVMLRVGISTLGVTGRPVGPFEVPWRTVLALTLLGVGIALIGSVYPILRARGTSVMAVLRGEDLGHGRRASRAFHLLGSLLLLAVVPAVFFAVAPVVGASDPALVRTILIGLVVLGVLIGTPLVWPALLGRVCGRLVGLVQGRFPLPARLARGSLEQNPTRIGASIAALALVTSAFAALEGMTRSLKGEIEEWADRALVDKVFLEHLPDVPFDELCAELHELPEVVGVEPGDMRAHVSFLLLGVQPDELAGYGPAADPRVLAALRNDQTIIVSERLAQQRGVVVGDELLVNTSGHGVQRFEIVAVSDAYGYFIHPDERAYGVTAARHLTRYFCLDTRATTTAGVRLAPGTDPGLVAAWLARRHPGARALGGGWVRWLHLSDLTRDFILFDIILCLTAALAGLGVLNGQLLSALERRKELGVLRALGMTDGQVTGAVLLESSVIGLLGGALGLAVGSALVPLVVSSLQVLSGLDLPVRGVGAAQAALFLGGAVVLAILAGIYPIWRMNRMDAVRAVRTG